jgi:hypothetical protein
MNLWKVSTLALAAGMTLLAGRDAVSSAHATPAETAAPDHGAVAYDWREEQPHMEKALEDLKGARHSLEVAAENKGGWRVLALKHTDEAIAEVVRGMEYAKNHPHD